MNLKGFDGYVGGKKNRARFGKGRQVFPDGSVSGLGTSHTVAVSFALPMGMCTKENSTRARNMGAVS